MNESKEIEIAFAKTARKFCQLGDGVNVRPWQALNWEGNWTEERDLAFPIVALTCGVPRFDPEQCTMYCDLFILCGTYADDDKNHDGISALFGQLHALCYSLSIQARAQTGTEFDHFKNLLAPACGTGFNGVGGITYSDGSDPTDDGGANTMGLVMRVHYSRD